MSFKIRIKPALLSLSKACQLAQEKVKVRTEKEKQLQEVTNICIENKWKRYQIVSPGLFLLIKDPQTINRHLEGSSQKNRNQIKQERISELNYLLNINRFRKAVSEKETGSCYEHNAYLSCSQ